MGGPMMLTAFVQTPRSLRHAATYSAISQMQPSFPSTTTTVLRARGGPILDVAAKSIMDPAIKAAALSFFNGVRIPATLIAGSSLAALFTMTKKARDTSGMSTIEIVLLRLYHILSLLSFCLSMTAVLTSTSASTMLLLHKYQTVDPNMDAYFFLRNVMDFEFMLTRWSFLTSLFCFLSAVTGRVIIEFDLWTKKRRLAGFMVFSKMTAVLTLLLSYVNSSLICWNNLWDMGKDVALLLWRRATVSRYPLQIVSMAAFGISALCLLIFLLPWTAENDKLTDHERYT